MKSNILLKKSNFSKQKAVVCLSIKLGKKHTKVFSKSQTMRRRLFPTNRQYRVLCKPSFLLGVHGVIFRIDYDPYRSSGLSIVLFANNICGYQVSIHNLCVGSTVLSSLKFSSLSEYVRGNTSILKYLPTGISLNQLEVSHFSGPQYAKSSGAYSTLLRKNERLNQAVVRLPSGRIIRSSIYSFATIGVVSNITHQDKILYKAGQNRWLGKRPTVRGVAKNPVDHPHGGGEGKKSQNMFPRTFWGKKLKWRRTSRSRLNSFNI